MLAALRALSKPAVGITEASASSSLWTRLLSISAATCAEPRRYDVCVVGAGAAGLAAAIKFKQACQAADTNLSVCVLEKAKIIGWRDTQACVLDPAPLNELYPRPDGDPELEFDWVTKGAPVSTKLAKARLRLLTRKRHWTLPATKHLRQKSNYLVSHSKICKWLAERAQELGVDIRRETTATSVLYDGNSSVLGVNVNAASICSGQDSAEQQVLARTTLFAEGTHGYLAEGLIRKLRLREAVGADLPTHSLVLSETWQAAEDAPHQEGFIEHTLGYPLSHWTYGGGHLVHLSDRRIAVSFTVGLDYANPYLQPYQEFQKWKQHPRVRAQLQGGKRTAYGAWSVPEGGIQAMPQAHFAGGALLGGAAGLYNAAQCKGVHMSMKSGILAGDAAFTELTRDGAPAEGPLHMQAFGRHLQDSWILVDLRQAQNIRPGFRYGLAAGLLNAGLETWLYPLALGGSPWRWQHTQADHSALRPAAQCRQLSYPEPDGEVAFGVDASVQQCSSLGEEAGACALGQRHPGSVHTVSKPIYDAPEPRLCPTGALQLVSASDTGRAQLRCNNARCLHCKACEIKDPAQNVHLRPLHA